VASKLNHHFVPQFLFRFFSAGDRRIHLVTKNPHRLIFDASVRCQCARHKFYGTQEVEDWLAELEGRHAAAFRAILREAWDKSPIGLSDFEKYCLLEGLMLQRARVPRTAANLNYGSEQTVLYLFREHVRKSPDHDGSRQRILDAIDRGQVQLKKQDLETVLHSIKIGLESVIGIADLSLAVLRNHTDYPFVFGDCPCVFYNRYFYAEKSAGVIGFQSPGLIIAMPLDSDTTIFLCDPQTYQLPNGHQIINVRQRSDVSQLNALQIHSAQKSVYFADRDDAEYVTELVTAHHNGCRESCSEFKIHAPGALLVDGKPTETPLLQAFESQLAIQIDLSFLTTNKVPANDHPRRARSPEIRKALKELEEEFDRDEPQDSG
jgi:hypothetical protein